jgi:glycosyltransferase involved in cell wall biosynthesis
MGPCISCLTVTHDRLILLKEAIRCYCDQIWPNREMVIVTDGSPRYRRAVADHIRFLGRDDIRIETVEPGATLGCMRNVSVDAARGEVICQWDDDDLYHPRRLQAQWELMETQHAGACFLTDHLQFLAHLRELRWIDWTRGGWLTGGLELVPGTVMAHKAIAGRYPERGRAASQGEDNHFRSGLLARGKVAALSGHGYLYLYRYHGNNTTPELHHHKIWVFGCLEWAEIQSREEILRSSLEYYKLPEPWKLVSREGLSELLHGQDWTLHPHHAS